MKNIQKEYAQKEVLKENAIEVKESAVSGYESGTGQNADKRDKTAEQIYYAFRNKGLPQREADEVILYGSRANGTARERSDINIAVSGVECFDELVEKIEELPTLYSVDLLNMDTCRNELLLEDIKQYGRKI